MTFENMSEHLLEAVPELRPGYEETLEWWDGEVPGNHVIYGDLLNPYLVSLLRQEGKDEILTRIFDLLEVIANHDDPDVRDVLMATVLWYLRGQRDVLQEAHKYMGPQTLKLYYAAEGRTSDSDGGDQ